MSFSNNSLGALYKLSDAKSRSISPENPTGAVGGGALLDPEDGTARYASENLGRGWKVNPYVEIPSGQTIDIASIEGPGCIHHIWLTPVGNTRSLILRIYWDGLPFPSVECPLGDFFAVGHEQFSPVVSLAVCVNPWSGLNCYWQMPFAKHCHITLENTNEQETADAILYYQINYSLTPFPDKASYFHAQFRMESPVEYKKPYTILDGVTGKGQYVGTFLSVQSNSRGWWGEGEFKFYLDDDVDYPTICTTGLEDYFCGSYNFENQETHQYQPFCTPYAGMHQIIKPDGLYESQQRFSMYRWHIVDPIRFESGLRVSVQALGWRGLDTSVDRRYLPLRDNYSSVAFWYQTLPCSPPPPLPCREIIEIN